MSKVENILKLLEQTDTINDYFDQWQSYFAPSDWEKIKSLLRKTIGIPFYQFQNPVSDDMLNALSKQNVPGNTIGQDTYFFYYNGVQNGRPYVVGGFGDPAEEPPKFFFVRKSDQVKWQDEFQGQLEDYNRLNLPTQEFPPTLSVSIGEPVGGHDKRSQEGISHKMGGGRAGWSKKRDIITRIQLLMSNLNPKLGIEGIRQETSSYGNKSVEELESIHKELFNQAKEKGLIKNRGESTGIAAGGVGKPVHAFSGTVNYLPKRAEEDKMSKVKKILDLLTEVEDDEVEDDDEEENGSKSFYRVVDLDERGSYRAHIEDADGKVVFSYSNEVEVLDDDGEPTGETEEGGLWLVDDGFMKHVDDLDGLEEYLIEMKVIPVGATLREGEGGRSRGGRSKGGRR